MTDFNFGRHLKPRFPLGRIMDTWQVREMVEFEDIDAALSRHANCDWGDVSPEDAEANDSALWSGGRLLSEYRDRNGVTFWIITEADRQDTTILLPED